MRRRFGEHRESIFAVEFPLAAELVIILGVADIAGVEGVGGDAVSADGGVSIQADAVEFDDERVAGHGTFNVKRAGFGIAAVGAAGVPGITAAGGDSAGRRRV